MRIGPNIPFHIARAYGVKPAAKPAPLAAAQPVAPTTTAGPARDSTPSASMSKLIGGTVAQRVDFDSASTTTSPGGPVLQLYTRAADRIEAATGIELGRNLDIQG